MAENVSHPGTRIKAWLTKNGKNQAYLAGAIGYREPFVSKLVNGHAHISPRIALKLEAATRIPAHKWLAYEAAYQIAKAREQV